MNVVVLQQQITVCVWLTVQNSFGFHDISLKLLSNKNKMDSYFIYVFIGIYRICECVSEKEEGKTFLDLPPGHLCVIMVH